MSNTTLTGAIVLRWRNRNILDIDGTNIYRSESPMDKDNLPPPYDFVGADEDKFVDYDVEYGKSYFYRIGVVKGDEELITDHEVEQEAIMVFTWPDNVTGASLSSAFFSPGDLRGINSSSIKFMEPTEVRVEPRYVSDYDPSRSDPT